MHSETVLSVSEALSFIKAVAALQLESSGFGLFNEFFLYLLKPL